MNQTAKELGLTPTEWDILEHRLQVSDAIAEALTDHAEDCEPHSSYHPDDIEECAELLRKGSWSQACEGFPEKMIHEILEDCVDGCTYFPDIDDAVAGGDITESQKMTRINAGYSLQEKISNITGNQNLVIMM